MSSKGVKREFTRVAEFACVHCGPPPNFGHEIGNFPVDTGFMEPPGPF